MRRKHTGEQFVCGVCHYSTHDRYGLNQHFKRHQNDLTENSDESPKTYEGVKTIIKPVIQPNKGPNKNEKVRYKI